MSLSRFTVIAIGGFFSLFCGVNAGFAFLQKNLWLTHLPRTYLLGYAAIYGIVAPLGLSGILGGLNRKRSLIKGFLLHYWVGSAAVIGLNVGNYLLARSWKLKTIEKCEDDVVARRPRCTDEADHGIQASLINTIVQSSILIFFGLVLLLAGLRQCRQIEMDEETIQLIEKQFTQADSVDAPKPARLGGITPERSNTPQQNTRSVYDAGFDYVSNYGAGYDTSNYGAGYDASNYGAGYDASNYDSDYSRSSNRGNAVRRQPTNASTLTRQPTNASTLTRQPTNASTLTRQLTNASTLTYTTNSSTRSRHPMQQPYAAPAEAYPVPPPVPAIAYDARSGQPGRKPTMPPGAQHSQYRDLRRQPDGYRHAQPVSGPSVDNGNFVPEDDYDNYWQPAIAKSLATNLTRRGLQ